MKKVISIRQPWAWLIVNGFKDVENRSKRPSHRGHIFIHASKELDSIAHTFDAYCSGILSLPPEWLPDNIDLKRMAFEWPGIENIERGGIVGEAILAGVITRGMRLLDESSGSTYARYHQSPWFTGQFGLILANRKPLPFMPMRGQLGIFNYREQAA